MWASPFDASGNASFRNSLFQKRTAKSILNGNDNVGS